MIRIKNLSKQFGKKVVLNNLSIEFDRGKIYGIIGENGAGKTTLFRCIAGLESFDGEIVSEINPLKDHLGYLTAEPFFFPMITGEEYIRLLCNARDKKISGIGSNNIFDLPLNQYVTTYSTGMRKKLALLAVLLQGNDIFILDEPFNGIDLNGSIILTEIIHRLKELGKTVIISSHIFSTLSDTCDEIHILREGAITQTVERENFYLLEKEMKDTVVKGKIEGLELG
ncbi:MAG: ATP-binding cassette domain-containing protein [Bacteroidales bacterium]|nr:ATP-binding cassette domain-containing protein [Bacteroidales bacterium]